MEGMFLKIENDGANERLVNLSLIDVVHLHENSRKATLWVGGVPVVADSAIAFQFFKKTPGVMIAAEASAVQTG
jgi:hypothetical protein